jgi:H+/gluconate symporter-like permease
MEVQYMLGYLGVFLGIALLVLLAFKRVNVIICTIVCSVLVGLTNGMKFWEIFTQYYLPSAGTWLTGYFLMFVLSGVYARVLSETGSAAAIAFKTIDIVGKKHIVLAFVLLVILLTYGGVSGLVSIFLVWPIAVNLARETNKSKTLFFIMFFYGFLTLAYTALPGSPQLSNILAAQMLGTSPTAGPVLGIIASAVMFVLGYSYLVWLDKKFEKQGKGFEDNGQGINISVFPRDKCPHIAIALTPMVVLLLIFMGLSNGWFVFFATEKMNAVPAICTGLIVASLLCMVLNWKRLDKKTALAKGAQDSLNPLVSLFTMVAFSNVVAATPAFRSFIELIIGLPGHPYLQVAIASNAIGLVTAAGSTTVQITLNSFAAHWLASGAVNPAALTRIVSIASVGLSCGPHAGGYFANLDISGETPRETYLLYFIVCGGVSIIALFVTIGLALLGVV